MKKTLLMTTALVAVISATDAWAAKNINATYYTNPAPKGSWVYNDQTEHNGQIIGSIHTSAIADLSDDEVKISGVYAQTEFTDGNTALGMSIGNTQTEGYAHTKKLTLDGSSGEYTRLDIYDRNENKTSALDLLNIGEGGVVNITNSDGIHTDGNINITGGVVNLNGSELTAEDKFAKLKVSGGEINISGNENTFNGIGSEISDGNAIDGYNEYAWDSVDVTGGKINVNSGKAGNLEFASYIPDAGNYLVGTEINISGGELNIAENSGITTVKGYKDTSDENTTYLAKSNINLTDTGTINLAGKLNANVNGDGLFNVKSSSAVINGDITGSNLSFDSNHSLSKAVNGTIGDLASLNVKKGTLTFDKTVGSINDLNVDGTLDIGTNTITATTANFNDNSTLALRIAGVDNHGKLSADNFTISENNTTMNVTLDNGIVANGETKEFQVLEGSFDGYFANKIADNSRYDIVWGDSNGKLTITGAATASDVVTDAGGSSTNAGTAEAWDSVTQSSSVSESAKEVSSVLNNLSQNANTSEGKKAYVEALTALAPEIAPVIQQTATETINQVVNAVSTRLTGGGSMSAGGKGASVGGKGASVGGKGNHMSKGHKGGHGHKNTNGHRNHRGGASGDSFFEKAALWVQTLFNKSELEDTSSSSGFDSETTGIAFGGEKSVTDTTKIGLGYAYSQTDIDALNRATDVETHTAILYGEYKPSQWYVNGVVTYGWSDYTEHKNVAGVNVEAKYDAESFGLQTMTGYEMNAKGYTIVPEVGLRFVHIEQDPYTDTADQTVSSDDTDTLTGVIATKVSKTWELDNGAYITPEVKVAATYDLSNDGSTSVVTLANGSAYTVNGEELDKLGFEFSTGVTAELNDKVEISVGYEGKFKEDYQDHSALLNVKYNF